MGSLDGYLQALSLVAIVILAPMTIHLMVHKEENTVFVFVDSDDDADEKEIQPTENETNARDLPDLNRSEVARIATFNIKTFGKTKMSNLEVIDILVDTVFSYAGPVLKDKPFIDVSLFHIKCCSFHCR